MNRKLDLNKVYSNIKSCSKDSNIKMSDIETKAEVSSGYFSRIASKDAGNINTSLIDFLIAASDTLYIPLDILLYGDINDLTETEKLLLKVINKLTSGTSSETILWRKEDKNEILNCDIDGYTGFPLTEYRKASEFNLLPSSEGKLEDGVYYNSCFNPTTPFNIIDIYKAEVFNGMTFFFSVLSPFVIKDPQSSDYLFELYQYKKNRPALTPLCSSYMGCKETFQNLLEGLYRAIKESLDHFAVSSEVKKDLIDFLNNKVIKETSDAPDFIPF